MSTLSGKSARRRELGAALRTSRRDAGLTGPQLAGRLGIAQSSISRMENGRQLPSPDQVDAWARATGLGTAAARRLDELAAAAATEAVSWRRRSLATMQTDTAGVEASAGLQRGYHPLLVPSLLQVAGYARASYRARAALYGQGDREVDAAVEARMARQALLHEPGHRFEYLVTEAGLRWPFVDAETQRAQLDRLELALAMPNLTLGVLPLVETGPVWRWSGFTMYLDRGEPEDLVVTEDLAAGLTIRDPADVHRYELAWKQLEALAVYGADAGRLLASL
jgi:transcriptional regulator with XRE-family HTH domain